MPHTVCIAGICKDGDENRVILCSDARIEIEGLAHGELKAKTFVLGPGCVGMLAGTVSRATELRDRYRVHLHALDRGIVPKQHHVIDSLRLPLREQQRIDIQNYVSAKRGMGYEEFLLLPEQDKRALLSGLDDWIDDCQLIVVCLWPGVARLFQVSDQVSEDGAFIGIGVGGCEAITSLMARKYHEDMQFHEAMYCVYEAKRNAERVPGVGETTYMHVLASSAKGDGTNVHTFGDSEFNVLKAQYKIFGPRQFVIADCHGAIVDTKAFWPREKGG